MDKYTCISFYLLVILSKMIPDSKEKELPRSKINRERFNWKSFAQEIPCSALKQSAKLACGS